MEVLVGLSLLAILLFALFSPLKTYIQDRIDVDRLKTRARDTCRFHLRLSHLFDLPSGQVVYRDGTLSIAVQKLLECDPELSGPVLAELKRTSESQVVLLLSPLNRKQRTVERTEYLIEGVDKIDFRFFGDKAWHTTPPQKKPSLVEITLTRAKETSRFLFELFHESETIVLPP
jgi:hypothetical protein